MYSHPKLEELRGHPQKVLDAIDEYGRTQKYLMNIGEYKSKTVVDLIRKEKPQIMLELGGYVGYSAIAFGAAVKEAGGKRYFSLEKSPEFGAVIAMLVDLAGLSDVVKVVVGSSSDSLRRLHKTGQLQHIDLLFLDHYKPLYTEDLKLCEELELVGPGSVYAADNGECSFLRRIPSDHRIRKLIRIDQLSSPETLRTSSMSAAASNRSARRRRAPTAMDPRAVPSSCTTASSSRVGSPAVSR